MVNWARDKCASSNCILLSKNMREKLGDHALMLIQYEKMSEIELYQVVCKFHV